MNNNNDHSAKDDKSPKVLNELEGLKEFLGDNDTSRTVEIPELDEMIPILNETIPVLDQVIPELTTEVNIPDNIKISFDSENSTETVEQQLIRTHHEQQKAPLELLNENDAPAQEIDETQDIDIDSKESEQKDFTFTLVESNEEPVTTTSLVQQQYDLEQDAQQQRTTLTEVTVSNHTTEALLDNAWIKVEMLLMDNLPTQISGAFLELLNAKVIENKLLLLNELELLDQDTLSELADVLDVDQ